MDKGVRTLFKDALEVPHVSPTVERKMAYWFCLYVGRNPTEAEMRQLRLLFYWGRKASGSYYSETEAIKNVVRRVAEIDYRRR